MTITKQQKVAPATMVEDGRDALTPPAPAPTPQVVQVPVAGLLHHPLTAGVPRMRPEERAELVADIRERGVQEPIRVLRGDLVLDGLERLDAARQRGDVTIPAIVVDLDEDEQQHFVYAAAVQRRHLSDDQRAALEARFKAARLPQERSERARKAGKIGGRGRPRKATDSPAHASSPELSPTDRTETSPAGPTPAATHAAPSPGDDPGPESTTTPMGPGRWEEEAARRLRIPIRKLKRARELDLEAPELAERVLQGDLTLQAATRQRSAAVGSEPAAGRRKANKRGAGTREKPRRTKGGLLLPQGTSPAAGRVALTKYFGEEWLGELASGVSPQPKVAKDFDTVGIAIPVAGATIPAADAAPAAPINTDGN
jgi:hypothetical protein